MKDRRRFLLAGIGLATVAATARAQAPVRAVRIGVLNFGDPPAPGGPVEPIVALLRLRGYVEGSTIVYERRYARGRREAYPALANELLQSNVDLIYAPGSDVARAFEAQKPHVPVVFTVSDDPVAGGLVQSMARPGGMFTGVTLMSPELAGKRLELLKGALPSLRRVAMLYDPQHRATYLADMQAAARSMGIELLPLKFDGPSDFPAAFADAKRLGAEAMFVEPTRFTLVYARRLGELAIEHRIAAISAYDLFAKAGGLMAYGARYEEQAVRAAAQIDRILKGAKPADLPVEQPTHFAFVINLQTAKALGLAIPRSLLLRADEVIQ